MHFLCEKDSISKWGECIYQNKGNCFPPFSDRHYLSRPMCVSGKYFSCGIQNLEKYVACGILACVASVSVRFRSKEWGTRVKDRAKNFFVLVSFLARSKPKVPFCSETKRKRLLRRLYYTLLMLPVPRLQNDGYIDFKTQTFWVMHCLVYRTTCFCLFLTLLTIS